MNLYDYLLENADPTKIAVQSREESVMYGDLIARVDGIAGVLLQLGIKKGEHVGIIAPNSAFWIASYLAIFKIGAVAVPFATTISVETFLERVELLNCRAYCAADKRLSKYLRELPPASPIVFPDSSHTASNLKTERICYPDPDSKPTSVDMAETDLAALMFTSGSTGKPNAVRVMQRNIRANTESIIQYLALAADDRMMVIMPLEYCFAASLLHTHLRVGGQLILNNHFHFTEEILDDIEQFGGTGIAGVPYVYQRL